jgi:methyl-accepting chemotaxis protein
VIDIHGGTLADGRIAPGSEIPRGQTDLERLQARADHLGDDLSTLVADMTKTVRDIETLVAAVDPERVTGLVEAVDPERVEAIVVHTERATRTLASTSKQLQRAVGEARADLDTVTKDVDEVANQATKTLEHADVAAKSLAGTIADADTILKTNEDDLRVAVQNLRQMAQDAKALVKALREQPSLLLRSGSRREARRRKRSERRRAKKSRKKPHAERGHD